jgi:hypothetical protein
MDPSERRWEYTDVRSQPAGYERWHETEYHTMSTPNWAGVPKWEAAEGDNVSSRESRERNEKHIEYQERCELGYQAEM